MAQQLLDVLFSGVKAFVREIVQVAREAVHVILTEIDQSSIGRTVTELITGVSARYFNRAHDLVKEENELARKFQADGRRTTADADRLREIHLERSDLRKKIDDESNREAVEDLKVHADDVIAVAATDDEISASTAIMAAKECPQCKGTMRIRQGRYNTQRDTRNFWWQCTATNRIPCPNIKLDPAIKQTGVIRRADPDLDLPGSIRREIWSRPDVLARTHGRVRQALGEADAAIMCPAHLVPMKLLPIRGAAGRMHDSYEYICPGVNGDGVACSYKVPLETFPQTAALLRRREGKGIIDS